MLSLDEYPRSWLSGRYALRLLFSIRPAIMGWVLVIIYCIIACIEDPAVIKAILAHLTSKARPMHALRLPPGRAPPAFS